MSLRESSFGLGLLEDTLVLEPVRERDSGLMLVLAFVENVLGYEQIGDRVIGEWEFKRTKGFK